MINFVTYFINSLGNTSGFMTASISVVTKKSLKSLSKSTVTVPLLVNLKALLNSK